MLRQLGILLVCLAVGSLSSLAIASMGEPASGPSVQVTTHCRTAGGQVLVAASTQELEVGEIEGVQVSVYLSLLPPMVFSPQGPGPPVNPPYSEGRLYLVDGSAGRALGLPWAVVSGLPLEELEERAALSVEMSPPQWSAWEFVEGELPVPGPGRWYAVAVARAPLNASGVEVDCEAFSYLTARISPGAPQALRALYLSAAGLLMLGLDLLRRQKATPSSLRETAQ